MESAILAGDLGKVAEYICNVFDPLVTKDHLELNYIKSIFNSYGSIAQEMTGSGSAVYAIVSDFKKPFIIHVTVLLSVMCTLLLVALSFIPLSLFFSSL